MKVKCGCFCHCILFPMFLKPRLLKVCFFHLACFVLGSNIPMLSPESQILLLSAVKCTCTLHVQIGINMYKMGNVCPSAAKLLILSKFLSLHMHILRASYCECHLCYVCQLRVRKNLMDKKNSFNSCQKILLQKKTHLTQTQIKLPSYSF